MSHRLLPLVTGVAICDAVSTLDLPPPSFGLVPQVWNGPDPGDGTKAWMIQTDGAIPVVDVSIWADGDRALTDTELFCAELHPFQPADLTVMPESIAASLNLSGVTTHLDNVIEAKVTGFGGNVFSLALVQSGTAPNAGVMTKVGNAYTFTFKDNVTSQGDLNTAITATADLAVETAGTIATKLRTAGDVIAPTPLAGGEAFMGATAHGMLTGDGPFTVTQPTLPAGLEDSTAVYVIASDANTFELADSLADALNGNALDFESDGSGTCQLVKQATTQRVHWTSHGLLGPAGDGVVSLTNQLASWVSRPHRPRVIAYALKATFGAGAGLVSAAVYPVVDMP